MPFMNGTHTVLGTKKGNTGGNFIKLAYSCTREYANYISSGTREYTSSNTREYTNLMKLPPGLTLAVVIRFPFSSLHPTSSYPPLDPVGRPPPSPQRNIPVASKTIAVAINTVQRRQLPRERGKTAQEGSLMGKFLYDAKERSDSIIHL